MAELRCRVECQRESLRLGQAQESAFQQSQLQWTGDARQTTNFKGHNDAIGFNVFHD